MPDHCCARADWKVLWTIFAGFFIHRRISKDVDRDFWLALAEVRKFLTAGRPISRGRDVLRYQFVHAMMNQVTTDPQKGLVRAGGMSKTKAIEEMAELERRKSGKAVSERDIYRSLAWVEAFLPRSGTSWNNLRNRMLISEVVAKVSGWRCETRF